MVYVVIILLNMVAKYKKMLQKTLFWKDAKAYSVESLNYYMEALWLNEVLNRSRSKKITSNIFSKLLI